MRTDYKIYSHIKINGKEILLTELSTDTGKYDFAQKNQIITFINQWLNHDDYIEVKTSGSTGIPKNIRIKKQSFINSALRTLDFFSLQENQNALLCLPVNFIAGKMMLVRAMVGKLNLINVPPSLNPLIHIDTKQCIDFAAMTPMQVQSILNDPYTDPKINQIKTLIIGGGEVSQELQAKLQSLQTACFATYGMTETVSHIALKKLNGKNHSHSYKTLPGIKVSIDDRSCLCIEAPELFEGKLNTNDVVELLWTNEFVWKGRYDNVINSGGIKIFPEELEKKLEALLNRPYFIGALKDALSGEKPVLIIEGEKFDAATQKLFEDYLNSHFEKHHKPRQVFFIDKFIYTHTGKINRNETIKKLLNSL